MKVTRKSPFTGKMNTMELPIEQVHLDAWKNGALIQNAMPFLTADQREFLMTGFTPEDWRAMFGDKE